MLYPLNTVQGEDLLKEYPSLERVDIAACLDYAASLTEELVVPIP